MAFTLSAAQTIDGVANSYIITGSGNLDDLQSACSAIGCSKLSDTEVVFDSGNANRIYAIHGLTEQREGVWTVIFRNGAHGCFAYNNSSSADNVVLGTVANSDGIATSIVNILYEQSAPGWGDVFRTARGKCLIGLGSFTHYAGSWSHRPTTASQAFDIWASESGAGNVYFDAVHINARHNHFLARTTISTTSRTRFSLTGGGGVGMLEAVESFRTISPISTTNGVLWLDGAAGATCRVLRAAYPRISTFNCDVSSTMLCVDPANTYLDGDPRQETAAVTYKGPAQINRTIKIAYKDAVTGAAIQPAKVVYMVGSTANVSSFNASVEIELVQSTKAAQTKFYATGVGYVDSSNNPYQFYVVAYGYPSSARNVNLKTEHQGTAGIPWSPQSSRNILAAAVDYASVVTAPFAFSETGSGTLTISENCNTDQIGQYLLKLAYDNAASAFWRNINHSPVAVSGKQLGIGAISIVTQAGVTVIAGTLTSSMATTGTITGAGTVSVPYRDSTGVRVIITNLDPQAFGTTWVLGWITTTNWAGRNTSLPPASWAGWNQSSGTGNSAQVTLAPTTEYQLFLRIPGYYAPIGPVATVDTTTQTSVSLPVIVDADSTGANLWPQTSAHTTQAAKFAYDFGDQVVEYNNTTGSTEYISFLAAYRALETIAKSPAMAYQLIQPLYLNGTKDGFTLPRSNPLKARMSDASTGAAILQADISYADNQQKAFDRFFANNQNAGGYLLIPQAVGGLPASTVTSIRTGLALEASVTTVQSSVTALGSPAQASALTALINANQSEHDATQQAIAALPVPLNSTQTQAAAAAALVAYDAVVPSDLAGLATSANVTSAQTAIVAEVNANEVKIDAIKADTSGIKTKTDTLVNAPTLSQIEASTVLAKEATVSTRASQSSVNAIPTNPLLANDTRLNNLDATISSRSTLTAPQVRTELSTELGRIDVAVSSRLATSGYTAPANADIAAIKAKTDTLVNAPTLAQIEASTVLAKQSGFAGLATAANVVDAQTAIVTEVNANETKIDAIKVDTAAIKAKTDTLVNTDISGLPTLTQIEASSVLAKASDVSAVDTKVTAIKAKTDTLVNAPTVADIEASTVLAKEATVATKASQSSVTALGSPMQASAYVAPDNTKIAEIKTKVDTLQNTDLTAVNSGIADIKGTGFDATKHNLVKIKQQASLAAALSA